MHTGLACLFCAGMQKLHVQQFCLAYDLFEHRMRCNARFLPLHVCTIVLRCGISCFGGIMLGG